MFPSIPSWDAVHPLIVHFPIALLLVAPILIIVGMLLPGQRMGLFIAAFGLIAMGTIGIYVAEATGEAAGELAKSTPGIAAILEAHEELAETARLIFTALTVIFAAILFGPLLFKRRLGHRSSAVLIVAFLILYSAGSLVLINVAHEGGRLVHEFGVRAMSTTQTSSRSIPEASTQEKKNDDGH
jgi:uncharacterized membrane protein